MPAKLRRDMQIWFRSRSLWLILAICSVATQTTSATEYNLQESPSDGRSFAIESTVELNGTLQTSAGSGKAIELELTGRAEYSYHSRGLPSAGRDEKALRALRWYDRANADITVNQQVSSSRLSANRRLIVAAGNRAGIETYSPNEPLTYAELDLLRTPSDVLATIALLPPTAVTVGQSWEVDSWAAQMLAGLEAALKHKLTCRLEAVEGRDARIRVKGQVEGATLGAATTVEIDGVLVYDLTDHCLTRCDLKQTEERSVGTVSPGMKVTATCSWERRPSSPAPQLGDTVTASIPLDPPADKLLLRFESPWNLSFLHDRGWHVFYRNHEVGVLRLLERGSLVAQCNVSPVPAVPAGEHTPVEQFQADIQGSLGARLKSIEQAEVLPTSDGRYLYRVQAAGEVDKLPMHWIYYLCASPSGKQVSFVFAVESKLLESLGQKDREIVKSLRFSEPPRISGNSK